MPEAADLLALRRGAIVAPAGHGKTELIAKLAAKGQRTLILTHTHAGVHAIRSRLKRLGVPYGRATVDTIAGWCMRYSHAFPGTADPPAGLPQGSEWDQLHVGTCKVLAIDAVQQVVTASYDRVLIDEYQDCTRAQHALAVSLSELLPTLIFGDPMQGIFAFAGADLNWDEEIYPHFPLATTLKTPYRWLSTNPDLGEWIAETRQKLMNGDPIDLGDPRITYRQSKNAFDMGTLFKDLASTDGTQAAIHCRKETCYQLAKASRGAYQAIEEFGAGRLTEFAETWDRASSAPARLEALMALLKDCAHKKKPDDGEASAKAAEEIAAREAFRRNAADLGVNNGAEGALKLMAAVRKLPSVKVYRSQLWHDAERALTDVATGRSKSMSDAVCQSRQRTSAVGRQLPRRTVSTPLLLKGLEFDHVVIPDAAHFNRESVAQAKLFYVAISRATNCIMLSAPKNQLLFRVPDL